MKNDEGQSTKDKGPRNKFQPPATNDQPPITNRQRPATSPLRLLGLIAFLIGVFLLFIALRGPLPLPFFGPPTPPSGDPQALAWLSQSDAAMNTLTSVKLLRTTRGDSGGVLTETMTFPAPDLFYSQISSYNPTLGSSRSESLVRGSRQYYRSAGASLWQAVNRAEPFRFPDFYLGRRALLAKLDGVEDLRGR